MSSHNIVRSISSDTTQPNKCHDTPEASKFRRALPQFLACMAKNLLLFDLGMAIGFPTIVIPVLLGLQNDRNPDEVIHMEAWQATWVGKHSVSRTSTAMQTHAILTWYTLAITIGSQSAVSDRTAGQHELRLDYRAAGPQAIHDAGQFAAHLRLDDPVLCALEGARVCGRRAAWPRRWIAGRTGGGVRGRNQVWRRLTYLVFVCWHYSVNWCTALCCTAVLKTAYLRRKVRSSSSDCVQESTICRHMEHFVFSTKTTLVNQVCTV